MKEKKLSGIVKEMAQQILCRKDSSLEAIGVAIKIVHIAWNFAHEEYKDEPGYTFGIKEIQERIGSVKNELISDNVEGMAEKLMAYKVISNKESPRKHASMTASSTQAFPYSGMDLGLFEALIGDRQ
jgi:hypothetical protein